MITIVVLNCSKGWCENSNISSTGVEIQSDSLVLIPISELKLANAKMIELKYEKEINDSLRSIIINDNTIISNYRQIVKTNNNEIDVLKHKINKKSMQRNIAIGTTIALLITLLVK